MLGDYFVFPPEVHSTRLNAGPKQGSLLAAASAWDSLGAMYQEKLAELFASVSEVPASVWEGESGTSFGSSFVPMYAWLEHAAAKSGIMSAGLTGVAAAFSAAEAAMPTMPELITNHVVHAVLVATNFLGINTVPIALNEADYARMWAQAATTMEGYEGATAASLTPIYPTMVAKPMVLAAEEDHGHDHAAHGHGHEHGDEGGEAKPKTALDKVADQWTQEIKDKYGVSIEDANWSSTNGPEVREIISKYVPEPWRTVILNSGKAVLPKGMDAEIQSLLDGTASPALASSVATSVAALSIAHIISHLGGQFVAQVISMVASQTAGVFAGVGAAAGAGIAGAAGIAGLAGLSGLSGLAGLAGIPQTPPFDFKPAIAPVVPPMVPSPAVPAMTSSTPAPPAPPSSPSLPSNPPINQTPTPPTPPGPGGTPVAPQWGATMPVAGLMASALAASVYSGLNSNSELDADADAAADSDLGSQFDTDLDAMSKDDFEAGMPITMGWMGVADKEGVGAPGGFQLVEEEFGAQASSPLMPGTWNEKEPISRVKMKLSDDQTANVFDNVGNSSKVSFSTQSGVNAQQTAEGDEQTQAKMK